MGNNYELTKGGVENTYTVNSYVEIRIGQLKSGATYRCKFLLYTTNFFTLRKYQGRTIPSLIYTLEIGQEIYLFLTPNINSTLDSFAPNYTNKLIHNSTSLSSQLPKIQTHLNFNYHINLISVFTLNIYQKFTTSSRSTQTKNTFISNQTSTNQPVVPHKNSDTYHR